MGEISEAVLADTTQFYLDSLKAKIWKLLPMREDSDSGQDNHLPEYLKSLIVEVIGALMLHDVLKRDGYYHSIVNTLTYMSAHKLGHIEWRAEVFKMMKALERMLVKEGGEADADKLDSV
jgi:hypothetical protein